MDTDQLKKWIWLNALPVSTKRWIAEQCDLGKEAGEIWAAVPENFPKLGEWVQEISLRLDADHEIDQSRRMGFHLLPYNAEAYPKGLKTLYHPPAMLYVRGSLVPADGAAIALVGTRHPSHYGEEQARRFSRSLAESGLTIISGLAKGIDQAAHHAALQIPFGRTIGVLGCGLDVVYPPRSEELYQKISLQGAVISEYPLGTPPLAKNFPERNRIIAALSVGVLVIEAHHRSGSLITAHEALEQGKDVFAVPGPVDQLTSRGTHRLIKEGAYLVECPEDVLEHMHAALRLLQPSHPARSSISQDEETCHSVVGPDVAQGEQPSESSSEELDAVLRLVSQGPADYDQLMEGTGVSTSKMMELITLLEMEGRIKRMPQGVFCKAL